MDQIWYIEADDYYVNIFFGTEKVLIRESLKNLEAALPSSEFCRIHKSLLVNLKKVSELENYFNGGVLLKLSNGTVLKASKNHKEELYRKLGVN